MWLPWRSSVAGLRHQPPHIDLAGDGGGDQGGAAFLEEMNRSLRLRCQGVKIAALIIYARSDMLLLFEWRKENWQVKKIRGLNPPLGGPDTV
jgi:hypothetical protein